MIIDAELLFADGTWAPTTTGDNISTNVLDLGPLTGGTGTNAGRDLGQGEPMWLVVTVKTTATSSGSATVDFRLRTAAAAALTSSPTDLIGTGATAYTALTAGAQFKMRLPSSAAYKRFIGVNANIGTAALTAGAFHVCMVHDVAANTKYASAFTLDV